MKFATNEHDITHLSVG